MRVFVISFAVLLALTALSPAQASAKEPGGAGHGGSGPSGGGRGNGDGGNHSAAVHAGGGAQNGDHQAGVSVGVNVGGNSGVRVNPNNSAGQAAMSHQNFDARNRPDYSGGRGEGHDNWRYRWDNGRWLFWGADNRWMSYGNDGQWQAYSNAYVVQRPILENLSGGPIKIDNPAANKETLSYTLDGNAYTIAPGYSQEFREDRPWVVEFNRGANMDAARYGLQSGLYTFTSTGHGWELYRSDFPQPTAPSAPTAPTAPPANPPQQ